MIGPVSLTLAGVCAGTVIVIRRSRDRLVPVFAWYVSTAFVASMLVHLTQHGSDPRSTALMWLDCIGLYLAGLSAVCRWQLVPWLCGFLASTALECVAHIVYVLGLISGDQHTLALNLLFLCQVSSLLLGRTAPPEEDLKEPFLDELAPA